jgi:outer membrane protein OmpA-like peptidoglycan-associated protein
MIVGIDVRRLACAGLLLLLAACTTAKLEDTQAPPTAGSTNEAAPGFENVAPGSEEDFILNVGRRVFFTKGSAELDSVAKTTLNAQVAWLQKYPSWLIKLQGFADDGGGDSAQVSLSQKRADAVMSYLASGGVATSRMWAKGYGKDREVRDCPQKACQVQNRRVVSNLRNERDT